jgi:glycine dehydrogenase subunit 2
LSLGRNGLLGTSNRAVLNANYLQEKMRPIFNAPYKGRCMHEFVFSGEFLKQYGVNALDLAKGLIDHGFHPPTIYFPLNVPEAIMIEPTETEDRDMLDSFVEKISLLINQAKSDADILHNAPITTPVSRLDEKKAAKDMRLNYS